MQTDTGVPVPQVGGVKKEEKKEEEKKKSIYRPTVPPQGTVGKKNIFGPVSQHGGGGVCVCVCDQIPTSLTDLSK